MKEFFMVNIHDMSPQLKWFPVDETYVAVNGLVLSDVNSMDMSQKEMSVTTRDGSVHRGEIQFAHRVVPKA
jgi:argonaute-like protein implicated in RNA metabolism and viral defense